MKFEFEIGDVLRDIKDGSVIKIQAISNRECDFNYLVDNCGVQSPWDIKYINESCVLDVEYFAQKQFNVDLKELLK